MGLSRTENAMARRRSVRGAVATAALALFLTLVLAPASPARAATLEGVTFPDRASVGGSELVLNGMGVRVAYVFVHVYVAGLYLPQKTHDGAAAVAADEPKRIVLH